jgi:hypothetical protein
MSLFEKGKQFVKDKLEALSLLEIGQYRPYDFYLIFGQKDENKSPWVKSNWEKDFEPYFDKLLSQTKTYKDTGIKVTKYNPENRIAKKDNKEFIYLSVIKTGRLKWDTKSHEKWTILDNDDNYFQDFTLWTPIWTVCDKKNITPDIFITIYNERDFANKREIQFGYFIVIAIAKNLKIDSKPILKELSEKINSKSTILKTRKWGVPENKGNWTFPNWIQDSFSSGIYKGNNLHSIEFKEIEFEPVWEIIHREK